jgi:site-specific recombinase XerD
MDHGQSEIVNVPARIGDGVGAVTPAIDPGLERLRREVTPPLIVQDAGPNAEYAYADFFKARIGNPNTRKAYKHAVDRFLHWCRDRGVGFRDITSFLIGDYLEHHLIGQDGHPLAAPSKKQHLAALRHFFANQQLYHGVGLNPAASVRGPKYVAHEGKTPAFANDQVKHLLQSIDTGNIVGLRDLTLLMVLTYTAARAGAVARLKIGDYYSDGTQWWFHFGEKGGKLHLVPARHNLRLQMAAYIAAAGLQAQSDKAPLFRSAMKRKRALTNRPLTGNDLLRIVKRRLKAAGLPEGTFSCHSFRATTATDLLKHDVPREQVQYLLGHSDARTTDLYNRTNKDVSRNVGDQISI